MINKIIIYLFLLYCLKAEAQTKIVKPVGYVITARTMQPDFGGYNGTNTITAGQTWKDLAGIPLNVASLYPNTLRYPGGTVANYWDWRKGRFLHNYEFTSGFPGLTPPLNFQNFNTAYLDNNDDDRLDYFKRSSDLTGSIPIINLNIFSSDYAYQLAMLYHAKEINLPVKYLELGNEYYNDFPEHRLVFPSVVNYANKVNDWATWLKNATIGTPPEIAVVGSWQLPTAEGRQRMWLDNLLPLINTNNDIDAVTIHQYLLNGLEDVSGVTKGKCLNDVKGGTTIINGVTYNNENLMMMSPFKNIASLKSNEFAKIVAANKEIWITEFNQSDHSYVTFGSWAHGMMVSTMLLTYLEEPAVAKVTMHDLVDNATQGAMFNNTTALNYTPGGADWDPINDNTNGAGNVPCNGASASDYNTAQFEKSAAGSTVALILNAMAESDEANQIDFANATMTSGTMTWLDGTTQSLPSLYGWQFRKPDSHEFIVLNLDWHAKEVDLSTLSSGTYEYETLVASFDDYITGNPTTSITSHRPLLTSGTTNGNLIVPAYSISRVIYRASPLVISCIATENQICANTATSISAYNYTCSPSALVWSVSGSPTVTAGYYSSDKNVMYFEAPNVTSATTYTVTVTDPTPPAWSASVIITVKVPPTLTVTTNPTGAISLCPPAGTATLTAALSNGNSTNYEYIWTPSYGLTSTCATPKAICNVVTVNPDSTTDYIVYATDGTCWVSNEADPVTVTSDKPMISQYPVNIVRCHEATDPPTTLTVIASPVTSYEWTPATALNQTTGSAVIANPSVSTTYTVMIKNNACTSTTTVNIKVNQNCCLNTNGNFDAVVYQTASPFIMDVETLKVQINASSEYDCASAGGNYTVTHNTALGGIIFINGYLEVNHDLTFTDCKIQLGEQTEIHVNKNCTLTFTGCDLRACTTFTWRSIYADEGAAVVLMDNSGVKTYILDGDTALNLANNALFNIVNSVFQNNYTGIYMFNYMKKVHQKTNFNNIYGNRFTGTGTLLTSPLGTHAYPLSGIDINYSENFIIGNASSNTAHANNFDHLYIGIKSNNANYEAYQNYFDNIQAYDAITSGSCIYAKSDYDANDRTIVIGNGNYTTDAGLNKFDGADIGINAYGQQNIVLNKNDFGVTNRIKNIGTFIMGNDKKTIDVNLNHYKYFFIGTFLDKTGNEATVSIDSNTYETGYLTNVVDFYGTAILALNKTLGTRTAPFTVTYNTITDARLGIVMGNMDKVSIGDYDLDDGNGLQGGQNTITYDLTSVSDYYIGITMQNCSGARIVNNTIQNLQSAFASDQLRAIDMTACTDARINCNTSLSLPRGIYFTGDCNGTKLRKNHIEDFENGVSVFDNNTILPEQGEYSSEVTDWIPYDNEWVDGNILNHRTHNDDVNPTNFNWYYNSSDNKYNPLPTNTVNAISQTYDCGCDCGTWERTTEGGGEEERMMTMGRVINDSVQFSSNESENAYQAKMNVYNKMSKDSSLIYMGANDDYVYEDFYNDMNSGNMGLFNGVTAALADSNNVTQAVALNDAVNDTNNVEYYLKTVNDIYLNTVVQGIELSSTDSSTLNYITTLPLSLTGNCKYITAAMIGKEVHESLSGNGNRMISINNDTKQGSSYAIIYPNPAHSVINISYLSDNDYAVELINANNQLCFKELNCRRINLSGIADGVYSVNILINDVLMFKDKLVVIN